MDDATEPQRKGNGWVLLFSLRNAADPMQTQTKGELLTSMRAWHWMRGKRQEPLLEVESILIGGENITADEHLVQIAGRTDYAAQPTLEIIIELTNIISIAFGDLKTYRLFLDGRVIPITPTKQLSEAPPMTVH